MGSNERPSPATDEQHDRPEQHAPESPTSARPSPGRPGQASGLRVVARAAARLRSIRGAAGDRGMATAEYAIATIAAVGFAGLLVVVLRSGEVQGLLQGLIRGALST